MKVDRALDHANDDILNREAFVETLARILVGPADRERKLSDHRATGVVAGLTGSWGAGKSSVLHLLSEKLGIMPGVIVVSFNPWLLGNRDALMAELFKAIRGQFLASTAETVRLLATDVDRYWRAVDTIGYGAAIGIDVMGSAGAATVAWSRLSKPVRSLFAPPPVDFETARHKLEVQIKAADIAVVVLIDELDRVEDDEVREVARLIKAVGEIAGISYLVAYDPARVADALGRGQGDERRTSGEAYLEKIIQYPIPLRPLTRDDVDRLLGKMLDGHATGRFASDDEHRSGLFDVVADAVRTPRDVKRLGGAFDIFWRVADGEICPIDVLAYAWLAVKYPAIRERIAEVPDRVVNDPIHRDYLEAYVDQSESKEPQVRLNKNLPTLPISEDADRLLRRLFPLLNGTSDHGWRDHDRLSRRRNLERLLYIGDPPGQVSRSEIEALWKATDADAAMAMLARFRDEGRLPRFLARVDNIITDLPATGDTAAFLTLSRLARRTSAYAIDVDAPSISSAARSITRLGQRDQGAQARIIAILDTLTAADDFAIVPGVIRDQVLAHGLSDGERPRGGEILTRQQTEMFWSRQNARYRAAILDRSWLRDWAVVQPVYVLLSLKAWDATLRESLTAQVIEPAAFTAFAAIILPPGTEIDHQRFVNWSMSTQLLVQPKPQANGLPTNRRGYGHP